MVLSLLGLAFLNPQGANAQNPPTAYTLYSTPYDGTESWYCERVSAVSNGRCRFTDAWASTTSLSNLTTVGAVTTGSISGAGFNLGIGSITYTGTFPNSVFNAAYTIPFPVTSGGTGTATPAMLAGNGISLSGSFPAQTITSTIPASITANPSNPAGTASTVGVMMGMGTTCTITPSRTGTVIFSFTVQGSNNANSFGYQLQIMRGTGTAPANAAASTGTGVTNAPSATNNATTGANQNIISSITGSASGMALGTASWFDIKLAAVAGGTALIQNVTCMAVEM